MSRCDQIKANVKMEECYAGLSFTFDTSIELRDEILNSIETIKNKTKMSPLIFDNYKNDNNPTQAIYIEFSDEVQRDSGNFFTLLLKELKIDKCINEVI